MDPSIIWNMGLFYKIYSKIQHLPNLSLGFNS
jgi:hypothetical protein